MRHTVIGLFNTYAEADGARRTLVEAGFAYNNVELRANPETASDAAADESPGVLANIERFFSSLFATSGSSETRGPVAEHYSEAVRRGAVLVSVDAANETRAELARNTLTQLGALSVNERARDGASLQEDADAQVRREHSVLDELGIGGPAIVPAAARPLHEPLHEPLRAAEEERRWERTDAPPHDTPIDDGPARTAIAAGGAPGSGAVLRPDRVATPVERRSAAAGNGLGAYQATEPPPAKPRDDLSRPAGSGTWDAAGAESAEGSGDDYPQATPNLPPAEPPDYPATTVRGAAQYQSDPSDIGRAASLPEDQARQQGQWPGQAQGQWPGQSQRQAMPAREYPADIDRVTGEGEPRKTQAGGGTVNQPYSGGQSAIDRPPAETPSAHTGMGAATVGDRGQPGRGANVRDEHQPPQLSDTEESPRTRTAPGAGSGEATGRDAQARAGSYAPNLHDAGQPADAGMMNESDARRGMGAQTYRPGDSAGRHAVPGSAAVPASRIDPSSSATIDDASSTMRGGDDRLMPDAPLSSTSPSAAASRADDGASAGVGQPIPDEFLEYEEDFHAHYDEQFGTRADARYDEYVPAYRYGATMGRDMRYQDRPWDDDVELEARHDWERTAPEGSWDRLKTAVRHGWERVTGHHH